MALADTLVTKRDFTAVTYTGGINPNYVKLDMGKYILDISSPDQPTYLQVKSNIRNGGKASDYLIRLDQFKNAGSGLPVGSPDAVNTCYMVGRVDYGAFSVADFYSLVTNLASILCDSALMTKINRGER